MCLGQVATVLEEVLPVRDVDIEGFFDRQNQVCHVEGSISNSSMNRA